jgi:hypothetical protein
MRVIKLFIPILGACILLVLIFIGVTATALVQEVILDDFPQPPLPEPDLLSATNEPSGSVPDHLTPSATDSISSTFLGAGDAQVHGLIYAYDSLWASTRTQPARILKIDPDTLAINERLELSTGMDQGEDIIAAEGFIWVILYTNPVQLIRVDPNADPLTYDVALTVPGSRNGMSLDYAFGYLWAGCIDDILQVDISDPLVPTYEVYDIAFLDEPPADIVFAHALTHDENFMWTTLYQYDFGVSFFISDTVMKFDPITPTGSFTTTTVDVFFPDDIAYIGQHLYIAGETVSPSDMYQFADSVVIYTSTYITDRVSYGTFAYPLDPQSVWAVYTNTPGTVKKFDLDINEVVTLTLPSGYDDPSELAFDPLGNMYVSTWQNPAGIVKYTAPTSITLNIHKSGSDAVLTWTHTAMDTILYRVWRSTDSFFTPGSPSSVVIGEVQPPFSSLVIYTDTGVITDTEPNYYYGVQTVNSYGLVSPLSNKVEVYALSTPGSPSLITPVDGSEVANEDTEITFQWEPDITGGDPSGYVLYVDSAAVMTLTTPMTSTSMTLSVGLHDWYVTAFNANGTSAPSEVWSLEVLPYPPGAPILVSPANGSNVENPVTFQWEPSSIGGLPTNYVFTLDDTPVMTLSSSTTSLQQVLSEGSHIWKVTAFNDVGYSPDSPTWSVNVQLDPPASPTLIAPDNESVVANEETQITFQWESVNGGSTDGYVFYVDSTAVMTFTNPVTSTNMTLSVGLHDWYVTAFNIYGTSAPSEIWSLEVLPYPPGTPVLLSPADGVNVKSPVTFQWEANPVGGDPSGYVFILDNTPVFTFTTPVTAASTTLTLGEHTWSVLATNKGGTSSPADVWTVFASYLIYMPTLSK